MSSNGARQKCKFFNFILKTKPLEKHARIVPFLEIFLGKHNPELSQQLRHSFFFVESKTVLNITPESLQPEASKHDIGKEPIAPLGAPDPIGGELSTTNDGQPDPGADEQLPSEPDTSQSEKQKTFAKRLTG